jgi:hypothetical protein
MTLRSALLAGVALPAAFGVCLALSRWGAGGSHHLVALARSIRHGEDLDAHLEAARRRDEARRALATEVLAGRMSLPEAAGHFRRLDEADPRFPPGLSRPTADEGAHRDWVLDYAWVVLAHQGRFAAAARWFAEVFTAHPHLLARPSSSHGYYAARSAARAGCGQARDAAGLDEPSRAGFRQQARDWLRAELEARRRLLAQEPEKTRGDVAGNLHAWLWEADFAGVRGPDALGRLPAAERLAWQKLWADVGATLARAEGTAPPVSEADPK